MARVGNLNPRRDDSDWKLDTASPKFSRLGNYRGNNLAHNICFELYISENLW